MRFMEEIISNFSLTMNPTEITVVRAQLANLESIRRRFRAIWCTDAKRFLLSKHFQEVAMEFWLHENWLMSLGLLQEDDNQLPSISLELPREQAVAYQHMLQRPFKVVAYEHGMKVISLFLLRFGGDIGVEASQWLRLRDEEDRFAHCCLMLQKCVHITSEGGMLWEDIIISENVGTQVLGKDDKLSYKVTPKEVFITRIQTEKDVAAVQLSYGWSSTVPTEEMNFVVEITRTGTFVQDLVIGSFKPVSIVIWNVRNFHRDQFADALQDLCVRNLVDVIFLFNTRLTSDGAVQGILDRLPYDTHYSTPEQDLRGGSTVMWNGSRVNLLCGGWKFGGEVNSWVSIISQLEEAHGEREMLCDFLHKEMERQSEEDEKHNINGKGVRVSYSSPLTSMLCFSSSPDCLPISLRKITTNCRNWST